MHTLSFIRRIPCSGQKLHPPPLPNFSRGGRPPLHPCPCLHGQFGKRPPRGFLPPFPSLYVWSLPSLLLSPPSYGGWEKRYIEFVMRPRGSKGGCGRRRGLNIISRQVGEGFAVFFCMKTLFIGIFVLEKNTCGKHPSARTTLVKV